MGYRDEGEAALHRVASLEQDLAEEKARAEEEAGQVALLQDKLAQANAEIVRLRGNPIASPIAAATPLAGANKKFFAVLVGFGASSLLAVAIAACGSESAGVAMASIAAPFWGAFIGGALHRRAAFVRMVGAAVIGAVVACGAVAVFFGTVWRHL